MEPLADGVSLEEGSPCRVHLQALCVALISIHSLDHECTCNGTSHPPVPATMPSLPAVLSAPPWCVPTELSAKINPLGLKLLLPGYIITAAAKGPRQRYQEKKKERKRGKGREVKGRKRKYMEGKRREEKRREGKRGGRERNEKEKKIISPYQVVHLTMPWKPLSPLF